MCIATMGIYVYSTCLIECKFLLVDTSMEGFHHIDQIDEQFTASEN